MIPLGGGNASGSSTCATRSATRMVSGSATMRHLVGDDGAEL